ncbi:MAG: hypothetical protein WD069_12520, partial [Planctomycetales bacterium]
MESWSALEYPMFRRSLRNCLVLTIVVMAALVPVAWGLQVRSRNRDYARLEAAGATVLYKEAGPRWLGEFMESHGLRLDKPWLIEVLDDGSRITTEDLRIVFGAESVEELSVYHPLVCDDNVFQLHGRSEIRRLEIYGGNISPTGYHEIGRITGLKVWYLGEPHVTSRVAYEISNLRDLEGLALRWGRLEEGSLRTILDGMLRLEGLCLQHVSLHDYDIDAIRDCRSLQGIGLSYADLDDGARARLISLTQLKVMDLRGMDIDGSPRSLLKACGIPQHLVV